VSALAAVCGARSSVGSGVGLEGSRVITFSTNVSKIVFWPEFS
jgi:hypothetical protein